MQELGDIDHRRVYGSLPCVPGTHSSWRNIFLFTTCFTVLGLQQAPGDLAPCWGTGKQGGLGGWGMGDRQEVLPLKLSPPLGRVRWDNGRE